MSTLVTAPITDVTIYVSHARITRRGKVQLDAGEHTLVISPITPMIEYDSMRAGGYGAGITIRSVDVKREYQKDSTRDNVKELSQQIADVQQSIVEIHDQIKVLENKLKWLERFSHASGHLFAETITQEESSFSSVTETLDYIEQQETAVRSELRDMLATKKELESDLNSLNINLSNIQKTQLNVVRQIHIVVTVETQTEYEFEVSYNVAGARWYPVYDLRLVDNEIFITYMAQVLQQTNEDWEDVALSLSTARPSSTMDLPEVTPWYVGTSRTPSITRSRTRHASEDELGYLEESTSAYDGPPAPQQPATIATATINNDAPTAVTYNIAGKVDIPSDGNPHQTTILISKLDVELDYFTAPRLTTDCYLRATVTNTSDVTLLPGTVSIFHDNDFVGKTEIETVASDETFEVQLGVDDRIRVERELIKRDVSKRLLGSNKKTTYRYKIKAQSFLNKSTKIKIVEAFPKSSTTDVKVELLEVSPNPDEQTDLNILMWQMALAPQQEITVTLSFSVEAPTEQLVNLD